MTERPLAEAMADVAAEVEGELAALLAAPPCPQQRLLDAMRYAALGAGKRLRPFLVHACAAMGMADRAAVRRVGAAVELIHCYSLIHDDLPAMDDAAMRRGKPSCHRAFDEATAILAGDALQALAFEALARRDWPSAPALRCELLVGLGTAVGPFGMCGGQQLDLEAEHRTLEEPDIVALQRMKTGALIVFACDAGARLGGLDEPVRRAMVRYGECLGLAFQIKDDLLDATGDSAAIGKDAGRDAGQGKATFVSLLGVEGAEVRLAALRGEAQEILLSFGEQARTLRQLFDFVSSRRA